MGILSLVNGLVGVTRKGYHGRAGVICGLGVLDAQVTQLCPEPELSCEQCPSTQGRGKQLCLLHPPPVWAEDSFVLALWSQQAGPCPTAAPPSDGCGTLPAADTLAAGLSAVCSSAGCDAGLRGMQRCAPHGRAAEAAPPDAPCLGRASSVFLVRSRASWSWSAEPGMALGSCSHGRARLLSHDTAWSPPASQLWPCAVCVGRAGEHVQGVLDIPQPGPSAVLSLCPVLSLSPGSAAWAAVLSLISCPRSHHQHGLCGAAGL